MEDVNFPVEFMEITAGSSDFSSNIKFVKNDEKAIPCPPSLLKPVKQIKFAPLTGQQIADFFSLTPGTKTFQDFIKEEM